MQSADKAISQGFFVCFEFTKFGYILGDALVWYLVSSVEVKTFGDDDLFGSNAASILPLIRQMSFPEALPVTVDFEVGHIYFSQQC